MNQLPQLAPHQKPNAVKVLPTIELRTERGDFASLSDAFVTEIEAFLTTKQPGQYRFRLISDDGARLWLDGRQVIDHDGPHAAEPKDGAIELTAGSHALRVQHYEGGGDEHLELRWQPPGADSFALVPPEALTHDAGGSREIASGRKGIIAPLRRGRPGDGRPTVGPHPGFESGETGLEPDPKLTDWLSDGRLRVIDGPTDSQAKAVVAWLSADEGQSTFDSVLKVTERIYQNHLIVQAAHGESKRVVLDLVPQQPQGCVFRLATPAGRIKPTTTPPFEMLAVDAMTNGLQIEFTKPLDPRAGWEADSYYLEQWPFDLSKGMSPTRDGATTPVKSASVSSDRRHVFLAVEGLKPAHVIYVRLLPPCLAEDGELPRSTEAWYTLNAIPKDREGKELTPPVAPPQNVLTEVERQTGWKLLFDGRTTKGWRGFRKESMPDGWQAVDGCLVRVGGGGDIITEDPFDDFEMTLEWRIAPAGNSGIFYRVTEDEDTVWKTGAELQVLDNAEHVDGRRAITSAGACYGLYAPPRDVTQPVGLFNKVRILARGPHVEYWLNDTKIVEFEIGSEDWQRRIAASKFASLPKFARMPKGHIALQDHGDKVWYRNIKVRPLKRDEEQKP
jgi:hypothetical protein